MNITIIGGGNIGTQFAIHCANNGHTTTIYTSKPEKFSKELSIVNENSDILLKAKVHTITNNPKIAVENADLIFVTVPPFQMKVVANDILPFVKEKTYIALIPGTGGGECAFSAFERKLCVIFGLQRVPSVARLVEYGKTVCAVGYRNQLFVASLEKNKVHKCAKIIEDIFKIRCNTIPCYLNLTLTPSNPILHTTRLYSIFKDYHCGKTYKTLPLFYENWNDETSNLLIDCDNEVQQICNALNMFNLSFVKSLKEHYESNDAKTMTNKISSIAAFKGLKTPYIMNADKTLVPDFNSRYFTADFSYGLIILKQIAKLTSVKTPNMDKIWNWYANIITKRNDFKYDDYAINSLSDFIKFYSR